MNLPETIKRPTLHEELVERLRNLVVEDALKPGEKVPEKELCESFGVSRTPLREALKVLASEGLVVLQANRGARVARVTRKELEDTFPVIAMLEQLAGELACQNLNDAEIARIEKRHDAMVKAYKARDRKTYFQANQDIHNALIDGAKNELLESHHRMLAVRVRRARFMVNLSEERWAEAIQEHEQMMEKLRDRDVTGLGQLMKTHMMNKFAAHIKALDLASEDSAESRTLS
ncbi:GntR family transcriptional regulator [Actibacterium sp. 188UL27-1]|uniref:GntR family transcriptional regulator n=1 Tax=Actibacterium sp. 188UL27-1 TaxID=2786961 RepID=UPI00195E3AFB|nr:GntR family transcriptional regulator [Actibacterium sp. 188UL27-1]MBM7070337.1 GntR family transcriptional regulator [Actibacterium sp. 188UL27-1]